MTNPHSLTIASTTFNWGRQTYLMGILNVTPDSFSGDGLLREADWIKAGGEKKGGPKDPGGRAQGGRGRRAPAPRQCPHPRRRRTAARSARHSRTGKIRQRADLD